MDKSLLVQVIVSLENSVDGDKVRLGTGYPVTSGRVITAAHVVGDATPEQGVISLMRADVGNWGEAMLASGLSCRGDKY